MTSTKLTHVVLAAITLCAPILAAETPTLASIHTIFVENMGARADYHDTSSASLGEYIKAEIFKQMKGRVTVVLNPADADAILTGTNEVRSGTGAQITGRYLGLSDTATGSIALTDKDKKVILWSAEAGDRSLWFGALTRGGQRKVASRLVGQLKKALK